ncbi:MAG: cytidylate kinase-like family protein [Candidatus Eisenbacteria bacterium]|uniref:Cytidylate kinase-like family protein n=1 Tax=Eiseniibacteriota bacterium TaxID=2212470 RepID=A0A956LYG6_UNCEI|nr:cytidylate kinase-like family protein [Candidatus Eisenbacteria bacterium]
MRSIQQIVDAQAKRWQVERQAETERHGAPTGPEPIRPWITIAREYGSGGTAVGEAIAARLGFQFYDRAILDAIAQESKYRREFVESVDERRRSAIEAHVEALLHGESFARSDFLRYLTHVLLTIGKTGHAVILGREAHLILPAQEGLSVRIVAPFAQRVATVADRLGLSPEDAAEQVRSVDRQRAEFRKVHFHLDAWRTDDYDLVLNMARTSSAGAVALIQTAFFARFPEADTTEA